MAEIVDAMLSGTPVYLLSPALLDEYRVVLLRPRLNGLHGLTEHGVDVLLSELVSNAIWREPGPAGAAPDPGDIYPDTGAPRVSFSRSRIRSRGTSRRPKSA